MRLSILLLALARLALASGCPPMLENVNVSSISEVGRIEEVVDVACGRRNFTAAFWSMKFPQELIKEIVTDELAKDNSTTISFRPLFQSVKDQYKSLDKADVKQIVHKMAGFSALQLGDLLPAESRISLAQATKRSFGVVESVEVKQRRIDTAMHAIERFGTHVKNERMADLFPRLYRLVKDTFIFDMYTFEKFAMDMEKTWNGAAEISHLEIVPAIETLYIQYNSLNNTDAKAFVDWILSYHALINRRQPKGLCSEDAHAQNEYYSQTCPSRNGETCFEALPEETKTALKSTFPEFVIHLNSKPNMDKFAYGPTGVEPIKIENSPIESEEGSGEIEEKREIKQIKIRVGKDQIEQTLIEKKVENNRVTMQDKDTGEIYIFNLPENSTWSY